MDLLLATKWVLGAVLTASWVFLLAKLYYLAPILWAFSAFTYVTGVGFGLILMALSGGMVNPFDLANKMMKTVQRQTAVFALAVFSTAMYAAFLFS